MSLELLQSLVSAYGPAGQEDEVRSVVSNHLEAINIASETDSKGNLIVQGSQKPSVLVTAHLDEIGLIVTNVRQDGTLKVAPLGGIHAWKLGEGPVAILSDSGPINGVLGFGSIHSSAETSPARKAEKSALNWDHASVFTGLEAASLAEKGVGPGTRVVIHKSRRQLLQVENTICGYFLDDRADLVSWLQALSMLQPNIPTVFAATAAEEVGGEGAQVLMRTLQPDVCIALELGPVVQDSSAILSAAPTLWVKDSYSTMAAQDIKLVKSVAANLGMEIQLQHLSRGGSDASCAASRGLCSRPITLGLPMENSHGYEIIHQDSIANLAQLTCALVQKLAE